jgi:hypothetical protein
MRRLYHLVALGLFFVSLSATSCAQKREVEKSNKPVPSTAVKLTFNNQLEILKELGFTLNDGIEISDITRWDGGKQAFEKPPFVLLYQTLGQTIEREPWTPLTNRCWDFDTEAIEDHGDYVAIMKNLERISRGEIKFENLKDFVDVEKGKAWVSFRLNKVNYKWDLKVEDDWVDENLFSRLVRLTQTLKTKGKYTYFNTGGQSAVIGFETPEGRNAIIRATGLKIEWLN